MKSTSLVIPALALALVAPSVVPAAAATAASSTSAEQQASLKQAIVAAVGAKLYSKPNATKEDIQAVIQAAIASSGIVDNAVIAAAVADAREEITAKPPVPNAVALALASTYTAVRTGTGGTDSNPFSAGNAGLTGSAPAGAAGSRYSIVVN